MERVNIIYGHELQEQLTLWNVIDSENPWLIPRSEARNSQHRISGIGITPYLSNKAIGICMAEDINTLLVLEGQWNDYAKDTLGILELVYQEGIFVIKLSANYLRSEIGKIILAGIFRTSSSVVIPLDNNVWRISYKKSIMLESIMQRFPTYIQWGKPLDHISSILLLGKKIHSIPEAILDEETLLISLGYSTIHLNILLPKSPFLIWLDETSFLNEIARDLSFIIKKKLMELPIRFIDQKVSLPTVIKRNGLDGI